MTSESKRLSTNSNANSHASTDAAVHLVHDLIDRAARHLETTEEKLRRTARETEQAFRSSVQTARDRGVQAGVTTKSVLQQHPVAAVAIALGIGAFFAMIVGGRNSGSQP